jgi:hypothetical protein
MEASSLSAAAIFMAQDNRAHIVCSLGWVRRAKAADLFFSGLLPFKLVRQRPAARLKAGS